MDKHLDSLPPGHAGVERNLDPDNQAIPADVRKFFDNVRSRDIEGRKVAGLDLPNLKFEVKHSDDSYVLFENAPESHNGHPTTIRELGKASVGATGLMSTEELEYFAKDPVDGSAVLRETNQKQISPNLSVTDVYQGTADTDHLSAPGLKQVSHKETTLGADGNEVSSRSVAFQYRNDNGNLAGEQIVVSNPSQTETITFQGEGSKLLPISDVVTPKHPEKK